MDGQGQMGMNGWAWKDRWEKNGWQMMDEQGWMSKNGQARMNEQGWMDGQEWMSKDE